MQGVLNVDFSPNFARELRLSRAGSWGIPVRCCVAAVVLCAFAGCSKPKRSAVDIYIDEWVYDLLDTIDNILGAYKEGQEAPAKAVPETDYDLAEKFDIRLSRIQEELEAARARDERVEHAPVERVGRRIEGHGDVHLRGRHEVDREPVPLEHGEDVGQEADLLPHARRLHRDRTAPG